MGWQGDRCARRFMSGQLAPGVLAECIETIMQIQVVVLRDYCTLLLDYGCRTMDGMYFVCTSRVLTIYKSVSCQFMNFLYWLCFRFTMSGIPMAIYLAWKSGFVCIYNSGNVAHQNGALCLLLWPLPRPQDESPQEGGVTGQKMTKLGNVNRLGGGAPWQCSD